jgi:hypothetical protein
VDRDDRRELLTIEVQETSGLYLPSRSLSEGTLRFLAICLLDADPSVTGVLCMEEPENGIHPARMEAMAALVRGLAVDPLETPAPDNPMRQVLVNTHSPHFVTLQPADTLLFAETATVLSPFDRPAKTLRLHPMKNTWRTGLDERGVGRATIIDYLTLPPNAQLRLEGNA